MSSHMSWHSSAAACSASPAGAHVRPLMSHARRSAAACAPSCGASRLGAAARRADSSVRTLVVAASKKPSGSKPTKRANPPTAPEAASPQPRQLLVSVAKPLVLPLGAFLGAHLLAGLPAGSAMQLAGLALAAQALAAAFIKAHDITIMQELLILLREHASRKRVGQASSLIKATAQRRYEAQILSVRFTAHVCIAVAALAAFCLLEAAGRAFGFSVAAAVESSLRSDPFWAAMGERQLLLLLLEVVLALLAISLFRVWRARSAFYAAIAERRRQNAARRGAAGGGGQQLAGS